MNSQWLGLDAQDFHKIKLTKSQYGLGGRGTHEVPSIANMLSVVDSYREGEPIFFRVMDPGISQETVTHPCIHKWNQMDSVCINLKNERKHMRLRGKHG